MQEAKYTAVTKAMEYDQERITSTKASNTRNGSKFESIVKECKDKVRYGVRDEQYSKIEILIRKILNKIDGNPLDPEKCVQWQGNRRSYISVGGHTVPIRRLLFHWYVADIRETDTNPKWIVNTNNCKYEVCCNVNHLRMVDKYTYFKEKKDKQTKKQVLEGLQPKIPTNSNKKPKKKESQKKIKPELAKEIWTDLQQGLDSKTIAENREVTTNIVAQIKAGNSWNTVTGLNNKRNRKYDKVAFDKRQTKKRNFYIKKHCTYIIRKDIRPEHAPTTKELYRFLKKTLDGKDFFPLCAKDQCRSDNNNENCSDVTDTESNEEASTSNTKNNSDCIIMNSHLIKFRGERISIARLVYNWFVGDIPVNKPVKRICGCNKVCIRPEHLRLRLSADSEGDSESDPESERKDVQKKRHRKAENYSTKKTKKRKVSEEQPKREINRSNNTKQTKKQKHSLETESENEELSYEKKRTEKNSWPAYDGRTKPDVTQFFLIN